MLPHFREPAQYIFNFFFKHVLPGFYIGHNCSFHSITYQVKPLQTYCSLLEGCLVQNWLIFRNISNVFFYERNAPPPPPPPPKCQLETFAKVYSFRRRQLCLMTAFKITTAESFRYGDLQGLPIQMGWRKQQITKEFYWPGLEFGASVNLRRIWSRECLPAHRCFTTQIKRSCSFWKMLEV